MQPNENLIREQAYKIWESEGKPDGCADEHWRRACQSLTTESHLDENAPDDHRSDSFIPHQNTKKGKHAHHAHHPQSH